MVLRRSVTIFSKPLTLPSIVCRSSFFSCLPAAPRKPIRSSRSVMNKVFNPS